MKDSRITASYGSAPAAVFQFWNMGGKIFDLPRVHIEAVQAMITALPNRPAEILAAELQLAETQAVRRMARAMEITEDVAIHQWARDEFWPTTGPHGGKP